MSGIVKGYGLDESFLELLLRPADPPRGNEMELPGVKAKTTFALPPFSLVGEKEYEITMNIIGLWDNPYLELAHSPDEILWSKPLYEANPSLPTEDLLGYDFQTLLRRHHAGRELSSLEEGLRRTMERVLPTKATGGDGEDPSGLRPLQERIEQLRAFIANIQKTEPGPL